MAQRLEESSVCERVWSTGEGDFVNKAEEEIDEEENLLSAVVLVGVEPVSKRGHNTVIIPRFAAALDYAKVSDWYATITLAEAVWSFNCTAADIPVNRSSTRTRKRDVEPILLLHQE